MKISHKKEKLLLLLGYAAIVGVFWVLKLPCVFQYFLKIPCPGCGMTRAVLCALRLDLTGAFAQHPMFWSLPLLGIYLLADHGLSQKKWKNTALLAAIGVGFFAVWIKKLIDCLFLG